MVYWIRQVSLFNQSDNDSIDPSFGSKSPKIEIRLLSLRAPLTFMLLQKLMCGGHHLQPAALFKLEA